jgi:branched-chain amino acid transport system permease protein
VTPLLAFVFSYSWLAELLVAVLLYAILAASLNLVTGYAGMFSLGHHGFFAVGAYAATWFASAVGTAAPGTPEGVLVFLASAAVAVVAAGLAGFAIGLPCLRLRGDYLAIATLAFAQIVQIVIERTDALGGSLGMRGPKLLLDPAGQVAFFRTVHVGIALVLLAGTLLVIRNLVRSAHGRAIVSIREDEVASEILGIRVARYKIRAFVLGSAIAGLAGWFFAQYGETIGVGNFDLMVGIKILLIVVLGGLGSLSGSVLAAAILIGVERLLLTGIFGETLKEWMQVEYALVLILLMMLRPDGIFGRRELSDLLRRPLAPPRSPP